MSDKQPLRFGMPTRNLYHGFCAGYISYHPLINSHIGVHVVSGQDEVNSPFLREWIIHPHRSTEGGYLLPGHRGAQR